MSEILTVESIFKVFSDAPQEAISRLRAGATKDAVLAELKMVVGLNDVSFSVPQGSIYMIMGLSGSGKSTLARCINRLNEPSAGRIMLEGRDILSLGEAELRQVRRTRISMVFQHFALLPNKRVIENVEFGLKLRGTSAKERRSRAEEVLAIVGLSQWAYHFPRELSGGMRQRVGLARALATDADILIMDEAFSALDPLIRAEMQDELLRLQRTLHKTILFITHDFQEAVKLGTRIAIMSDGRIIREGTPQDIVLDPGSEYVGAFTREVDRSRLFDASSMVVPDLDLLERDGLRILQSAAGALVLDPEMRVLGALSASDVDKVRGGQAADAFITDRFTCIGGDSKLIDVARAFRPGQPLVVVDEDARALGTLSPEGVLARISTISSVTDAQKEVRDVER